MPKKTLTVTRSKPGDTIVDSDTKVLEDYKAEPGETAYVFFHTVPFEGSVGLINLLTATRIQRKGYKLTVYLFGPGVLLGAANRGYPAVGQEGFPGHLNFNKQIQTLLNEGATIYVCRFAMAALYGMREEDLMEGLIPLHPNDLLDCMIKAHREHALVLNTWTV